jgi:hypothetical protein
MLWYWQVDRWMNLKNRIKGRMNAFVLECVGMGYSLQGIWVIYRAQKCRVILRIKSGWHEFRRKLDLLGLFTMIFQVNRVI